MAMIDEIKTFLNITDTEYDAKLEYYIDKINDAVIEYCNLDDLKEEEIPAKLTKFVKNKVISIMQDILDKDSIEAENNTEMQLANQGAIKSISRGDTKIDFNYNAIASNNNTSNQSYVTSLDLTQEEKNYLNKFRKIKW